MKKALIVSSSAETAALIRQLLHSEGFGRISAAPSGNEARRMLSAEQEPQLLVIDTPLDDEFGTSLAEDAASDFGSKVILLCGADIANELYGRAEEYNICIISKPIDRSAFSGNVQKYISSGTEPENAAVLARINEIRLINRAKAVLIKYLGFTEPQAHRYIEKQAMNNRQTRLEAAEKIIDTYEK